MIEPTQVIETHECLCGRPIHEVVPGSLEAASYDASDWLHDDGSQFCYPPSEDPARNLVAEPAA